MIIINRIKSDNGILIGYTIQHNMGEKTLETPAICVKFRADITNADCINIEKGLFRAKGVCDTYCY